MKKRIETKSLKQLILGVSAFILIALSNNLYSQSGVGINSTAASADPSAMLDVSSINKGLLVPRMTLAEKNAIVTPANGLLIYQIDGVIGFWHYNGTTWVQAMGPTGATGTAGTNGTNGATGSTGATGTAGTNGTNGTNGATGSTGATGAAGTNGTNGTNGTTGATGATGTAGTNGTNGTNGATGSTGATGTAGTNGTNGVTGATGPNNVTTSTTTNVTGILLGNGSVVSAATAGTDYEAPWTRSHVSGSNATTTGSPLVNITGLSFAATANTTYEIEAVLIASSTTNPGCEYGINLSGSTSGAKTALIITGTSTAANLGAAVAVNSFNSPSSALLTVSNPGISGVVYIHGYVTTGSSAPGNITLMHLEAGSGVSTVYIGSVMKVRIM